MIEPSRLADVMRTLPERKERKKKKAKRRAKLANYNVRFGLKPNVNQMPKPIQKFNIRHIFESKFPQYYLHDVVMNRRVQSANVAQEEAPRTPRRPPPRDRGRQREVLAAAERARQLAAQNPIDFNQSSVVSVTPKAPPSLPSGISVDTPRGPGLNYGELEDGRAVLSSAGGYQSAREEPFSIYRDIYRDSNSEDVDRPLTIDRPPTEPPLSGSRSSVKQRVAAIEAKEASQNVADRVKTRTDRKPHETLNKSQF